MRGILVRWVINAVALLLIGKLISGIEVAGFGHALLAALVLGILNAVIRPVLVLLTLPLTIFTLGLFLFVVNALVLWLMAAVAPGIEIHGFWSAMAGAFLFSVVGWITNSRVDDRGRVGHVDLHPGPDGRWS